MVLAARPCSTGTHNRELRPAVSVRLLGPCRGDMLQLRRSAATRRRQSSFDCSRVGAERRWTGERRVVPVDSATLPRHLGTLASDHFGLIGWAAQDVIGCYRRICQTLQAE